ncbi:MAG: hypothetical protein HOP10_10900 [Chitinophagaceae bacterium]|nr:hypothetical protein [Chitinophagaceae bacterium]
MSNNPQFIKGAIITVIIAGAIGALTVLAGDSFGVATGDFTGKLFLTSFSLIFFGITGAICMVVTEKPEYKGLGNAGMIVSSIGFFITLILIFVGVKDEDGDATVPKLAISFFLASIALAHISLLFHFNLRNRHAHNARMTATIFISIFTFALIILVFSGRGLFTGVTDAQTMAKIIMVSLVIDLAATVLVPLCNRLPADEQPSLSFDNDNKPAETQPEAPQQTGDNNTTA